MKLLKSGRGVGGGGGHFEPSGRGVGGGGGFYEPSGDEMSTEL